MEAYLSKALWRSGAKLGVGLAVLVAIVGLRYVTATPAGLESDLAELERFDAEQAAAAAAGEAGDETGEASGEDAGAGPSGDDGVAQATDAFGSGVSDGRPTEGAADANAGLDRMVRCRLGRDTQFMRAADCATRGGELEELPPPPPEEAPAAR